MNAHWSYNWSNCFEITSSPLTCCWNLMARSFTDRGRSKDQVAWSLMLCRAHICHGYHRLYPWRKNCRVEKFALSIKKFEQFMEFYQSLCRFCSKSLWRKICVAKISVEKKWQIWGLMLCHAMPWYASTWSLMLSRRRSGKPRELSPGACAYCNPC